MFTKGSVVIACPGGHDVMRECLGNMPIHELYVMFVGLVVLLEWRL